MKLSKTTIQKIIKEEIAKILKERYQPSSDDPPHKVNSIRIQELGAKASNMNKEIDQLFELLRMLTETLSSECGGLDLLFVDKFSY